MRNLGKRPSNMSTIVTQIANSGPKPGSDTSIVSSRRLLTNS
jgi:hypothetical protein